MHLEEVQIQAVALERFDALIGAEAAARLHAGADRAREALRGRTLFNVNSTAVGGGVAEMLQPLLACSRGAGVDARWLVVRGDAEFFRITKRLHNRLHGAVGDAGRLGEAERAVYDRVLSEHAAELLALVGPEDVVLLHDPQTAGLLPVLQRAGVTVVWRSHIVTDHWNDEVASGWAFLRPYLEEARAVVFTRRVYAPDWLRDRAVIIPPSIDPFSVKNAPLDPLTARNILARVGVLLPCPGPVGPALYQHVDGSPGRVDHGADVVRCGPPPTSETPLILHVSRWDRLKDMSGVLEGFARRADALGQAQSALVGPNVAGVYDDPEGAEVFEACIRQWRALPHAVRRRVQLLCLPCRTGARTRPSSTRCSATRPWWCRRAWRRASGSPWPRRCGRGGRWWAPRWGGSTTSWWTARAGCWWRIRGTWMPSETRSCASWGTRRSRRGSARRRMRVPAPTSSGAGTCSSTRSSSRRGWGRGLPGPLRRAWTSCRRER